MAVAAAYARPAHHAKKVVQCNVSVGVLAPVTGQVAAIGEQMLRWSQVAFTIYNRQHHTHYRLVEGDTQLLPAQASTIAQQFISNKKIVGIVGPPSSSEVQAISPLLKRVSMVEVSSSATNASLTQAGYTTFFRVVPNDGVQGPTDGAFIVSKLHAKKVFVLDNQSAASTGMADSVQKYLQAHGVAVQRESVGINQTDFSSLVARIASGTDVVFIPFVAATSAQLFVDQMHEQGKTAIPMGSDAEDSPDQFHPEGGYVSSFAPDVTQIKANAAVVKLFQQRYGQITTTFGPPMYAASWVVLDAVNRVCQSGRKVTRAAVLRAVRTTHLKTSILGGPLSFTAAGDVKNAHYYIFKTHANGTYELVHG